MKNMLDFGIQINKLYNINFPMIKLIEEEDTRFQNTVNCE